MGDCCGVVVEDDDDDIFVGIKMVGLFREHG